MITAKEWSAYNEAVSKISDGASASVEKLVLEWCASNPGASPAEAREAAKLIMDGYVQGYDSLASSFAASWYDRQAKANGAKLRQAVTSAVYAPRKTDSVARYQVRKLADEGPAAFAKACGEYARNDALRALNETIMANAERDRSKGVRFARVPTGRETCTFCLMLASRGAVYHTRQAAGEFRHFHRGCDCKVIPGFEDDPDAELVEGYRPRELYDAWKRFKEIEAYGLPRAQEDALKMTAYRALKMQSYSEKTYVDALDAAIRSADRGFRKNGKTVNSYDATVNKLLSLLGEQAGIKLLGSWVINNHGKLVFVVPDCNELWVALTAMNPGDEITFMTQEREVAPDVKTANGYAEFKTPKSTKKVADRLKHAAEQIGVYGDQDSTVYLSLLRLNEDEQEAVSIAQRFVDDGTIRNLCVVRSDGTTQRLKKKDTGLGS